MHYPTNTFSLPKNYGNLNPIRWAFVGINKISHDFATALKGASKDTHEIEAVWDSNESNAMNFATKNEVDRSNVWSSYREARTRLDIDVVYVNLPSNQTYEVVMYMLKIGKNVLCQPPLAINLEQTMEIIEMAKKSGIFFMEAVWSRCFPIYKLLRNIIRSEEIGEIVHLKLDYGFKYSKEDSNELAQRGDGAVRALAILLLQFEQFVFDTHDSPKEMIVCTEIRKPEEFFGIMIKHHHDQMALLSASLLLDLSNTAIIYGTRGNIEIKDFWCPTVISVNGISKTYPLMKNRGQFNYYNGAGYAYEAEEVRNCILNGLTESSLITHNDSIAIAKLLDELRYQIGAFFPEDHPDQNCQQDQLFTPTSSVQQ